MDGPRFSERESTQQFEIAVTPVRKGGRHGVLALLSGQEMGRVLPIPEEGLLLGRAGPLELTDQSLSRRHARFFSSEGHYFVEDLHSTNGTFVEGRRIFEPTRLIDGAGVQLGKSTLLRFTLRDDAELERVQRTYLAAARDHLTGLHNRAFLDERLASELSYARRHGTPLAVLFVDADHFKRVNDTHGHAGGDAVLVSIARFLESAMRTEDIAARYGGEEFVLVLRGIELAGVQAVAERVRRGVAALRIEHLGVPIPVTISIGVALSSKERAYASVAELLAAADGALYRAKELGRNRVVFGA